MARLFPTRKQGASTLAYSGPHGAKKCICASAQAGAVFLRGGVEKTRDLVQQECPSRRQNTTHQDLG